MAITTLQSKQSPGAIALTPVLKKALANRFLPKLIGGILRFNGLGELVADTDLTVLGRVKKEPSAAASVITTAGAGTYTAAQLLNGVIARDPNGAGRTDTTDTAANIITGLGLNADYKEAEVVVVNTADAAETITLAGGSGVTLKGAITIAQNQSTRLAIMRTGAAAVCIREV